MAKRKIIKIDEEKCTGCGVCIPNCPEGALQLIDDKARLISDLFCDGLGACIGECPEGAIAIEEREAAPYDERKVMENIIKQGKNVIKAHLEHLEGHGAKDFLAQALEVLKEKGIENPLAAAPGQAAKEAGHAPHMHGASGCPGARMMDFGKEEEEGEAGPVGKQKSQLRQWPVQIMLVPPNAPYFQNADLLIAADCVPFAYPDFHPDLLKGKILLVGCPKLDDVEFYQEKITQILKANDIKSITCAHMEVPCCFGLVMAVREALSASGKSIPFEEITIGVKGEKK